MTLPSSSESPYRVTLFFGPEPVEDRPDAIACVFNVKKRSWKAGVQVSVEIGKHQLSVIHQTLDLRDRLTQAFNTLDAIAREDCEARVPDLFAQAVSWCKLDLRLRAGLPQQNQRIPDNELMSELQQEAVSRKEYVLSYILTELDLSPGNPSPSSYSHL